MNYKRVYTGIAIVLLQFVFTSNVFATTVDTITKSKSCFYAAKQEITNMLEGKIPLNYERAEFLVENAYRDNQESYRQFQAEITQHVEKIRNLAIANSSENEHNFKFSLLETDQQKREKYNKAYLNYAIFQYLTDTTFTVNKNNSFSYHLPYLYSNDDPFGTNNWYNTQVFNLLDHRKNKGNCYALVSLFKILSERLKTGAIVCTAPGHIYIRHADNKGVSHNVELATRSFPGTGSISTITYTTDEALMNNIALRELNLKQSVALCLVYLAKGYEHKYNIKDDDFMLQCAEIVIKHDYLSLNAMLLKAEILEERLIKKKKTLAQLKADNQFKEYEKLISQLYILGYREMPIEMKNRLISAMKKDGKQFLVKDHTPQAFTTIDAKNTRYATLSSGRLEELHENKPFEQFNRTVFDAKRKKISKFVAEKPLYNHYNFDPVIFAWQIDPLSFKYPNMSPYAAFENNPIYFIDPDGKDGVASIKNNTITITAKIYIYGDAATQENAVDMQKAINNYWNSGSNKDGSWNYSDKNGTVYNVKFNAVVEVYNPDNPEEAPGLFSGMYWGSNDNYVFLTKDKDKVDRSNVQYGNRGYWNVFDYAEPHEFGHLLGLDDQYKDLVDPVTGETYSQSFSGWEKNIMGDSRGLVDQRNIDMIVTPLVNRYNQHLSKFPTAHDYLQQTGVEYNIEADPTVKH